MSWLQRLSETYDACFGQPQFQSAPLAPIDHVEQQAHVEIAIDHEGHFLRASVVQKEVTLIPATERSAGRTSGAAAHPLCDKLRYIARDYGSESDHELYLKELRGWVQHSANPKLAAVLNYVERGRVVQDLIAAGVVATLPDGVLEIEWKSGPSALAKLLTAHPKTKERDQGDSLIRWRVEAPGELESAVWKDARLQREWAAFNATLPSRLGLCFHSGMQEPLASNHPKRLRHGGDGAKLISANDSPFDGQGKPRQHGYTFVGRFTTTEQAYGLGSATTQKAHNALRWLIARQAFKHGDQVIVAWAVQGAPIPPIMSDGLDFLTGPAEEESTPDLFAAETVAEYQGDAGQFFAHKLAKAIQGYSSRLDDSDDIVVMALDSATPGRMAILYYRELRASELLARLERWHSRLAWPQNFGKERQFTGAPAPRDIAEAAYGPLLRFSAQSRIGRAGLQPL